MSLDENFPVEIERCGNYYETFYGKFKIKPPFVMTSGGRIAVMYNNKRGLTHGRVNEERLKSEKFYGANAYLFLKGRMLEEDERINDWNALAYLIMKSIPEGSAEAEREKMRKLNEKQKVKK